MASAKERLVQWLRDAHAMEEQSEQTLTRFAGRIENYPDLKAQIERHIEETRNQAKQLHTCLDRQGVGASAMKDAAGKIMAFAQGMSGFFVGDEIVKGSLACYTFEHMEIASYRILVGTAEAVGDMETKAVCEAILAEEIAMAAWLDQNLATITKMYLAREEAPEVTAKH